MTTQEGGYIQKDHCIYNVKSLIFPQAHTECRSYKLIALGLLFMLVGDKARYKIVLVLVIFGHFLQACSALNVCCSSTDGLCTMGAPSV